MKGRLLTVLALMVLATSNLKAQGLQLDPETLWDQFTFSSNFDRTDASSFSIVDADMIRKAVWSGDTFCISELHLNKDTSDASKIWIYSQRTSAVRGSDGKIKTLIFTVSDITESLLLHESLDDVYSFSMMPILIRAVIQARTGTVALKSGSGSSYEYKSPRTGKKALYTLTEDTKKKTFTIKIKIS